MAEELRHKILLVEDEPLIALDQKRDLEKQGYAVVTASTSDEALGLFRNSREISLVLMDIDLGDSVDGTQLAKELLQHRETPVVFLSSHTEPEIVEKTEKVTSYGYVVKNSGITVLDASVKMAYRLFEEKKRAREHQKKVEEFQNRSEDRYRKLYSMMRLMSDTMPDMLWAKDLNKRYLFANKAICEKLLNARDTDEPLGKTDLFFAERERSAHTENTNWHNFGELCQDSDAITLNEKRQMQFDEFGNVKGEFLYLDVHKAPIFNDKGKLIGVVGSARDITAKKRAEDELQKTLKEKKDLLRELQHRAKNSFAMIFSMVQIASYSLKSEEGQKTLEDISLRIKSLSHLYEMLYSTDSVTQIHLASYCEKVIFSIPANGLAVNFSVSRADKLTVKTRCATYLGIIITELVTNAVRHAFPENKGHIDVKLNVNGSVAMLEIKDNGQGIVMENQKPPSFGLKIVESMVATIKGRLDISSHNGTCCCLEFPIDDSDLGQ